jgi:hypothetical protein
MNATEPTGGIEKQRHTGPTVFLMTQNLFMDGGVIIGRQG